MRSGLLFACAALLLHTTAGHADIPHNKIKFGIIQTAGPQTGRTSRTALAAAQMAAEDFEARSFSLDTEIKEFDSNRPVRALAAVRDWLKGDDIDAVIDVAGTADSAAIARLMQAHHRLFILIDLGSPALRHQVAGPTTLIWGAKPAALSHAVIHALAARGGDGWFFSIGSGPLAQALATDGAHYVISRGGMVKGMLAHPLGLRDFGPDLRTADRSGAKVIALSETGPELTQALTESTWLGLSARHQLAALFAPLTVIDAAGLQAAQGTVVAEPFYWDRNKASREFAGRFARIEQQRMPTEVAAMVYSATTAMLHAAATAHSVDASKIIAELRHRPIQDQMLGTITVGPDLVARHDIYVFRVKKPGQSQRRWDDLTPIATVPAAEAFASPPAVPLPQEQSLHRQKPSGPRQHPSAQARHGSPASDTTASGSP